MIDTRAWRARRRKNDSPKKKSCVYGFFSLLFRRAELTSSKDSVNNTIEK